MKILISILLLSLIAVGCGDKTATTASSSSTLTGTGEAEFASLIKAAIPEKLRTGGAASRRNIDADFGLRAVSPGCSGSDTTCNMVDSSSAGDIFMKVWAMDYNDYCTAEKIATGECFTCNACNSGSATNYKLPTMISNPDLCGESGASDEDITLVTVNFNADPCNLDALIGSIENFNDCSSRTGIAKSITDAVPWAADWGIPTSITLQGVDYLKYWGFIDRDHTKGKYMLMSNSSQISMGIKDVANNQFITFILGSASSSMGSDGPNLIAYAGNLTGDRFFETLQVRNQSSGGNVYKYIARVKSNAAGTHIYYQTWTDDEATSSPGANDLDTSIASASGNPDSSYCAALGTTVAASTFVPLSDCISAFGFSTQAELDAESGYILKLIPLSKVAFSGITFGGFTDHDAEATACL